MRLTGKLCMELALLGTMNFNAISLNLQPKIQQLVKLLSRLQGEMMTKFILLGLKKLIYYHHEFSYVSIYLDWNPMAFLQQLNQKILKIEDILR